MPSNIAVAASCVLAGSLLATTTPLRAQDPKFEVRLKRAWVQAFADRTSIVASMEVRHSHTKANPVGHGGDDGDMHFSGVSHDVGLPFVAEVVNAGLPPQKPRVSRIVAAQQSGTAVAITGAWRLWFEHPATRQTQGGVNKFYPDHTNPDHSFEIHPISRVNQDDVGGSFIPIAGYQAYTAAEAFAYFDQCVVTIKASSSGISIRSKKLKFNYVEFEIQLEQNPKQVQDGWIALARVLTDQDDEAANGQRRMIFVQGTRAAQAIQNASAGDRFRVLGIPRINLDAVLFLVHQNGTQQFNAPLPYEMIIVGVL